MGIGLFSGHFQAEYCVGRSGNAFPKFFLSGTLLVRFLAGPKVHRAELKKIDSIFVVAMQNKEQTKQCSDLMFSFAIETKWAHKQSRINVIIVMLDDSE